MLAIAQGFALINDGESPGVSFSKANFSETLTKADKYLKDPVIYDHIGDVYHKMNHIEDAIRYWKLSLQLLPKQKKIIKKIDDVKNTRVRRNTQ